MQEYDPAALAWTDLSAAAGGTPPSARDFHGFAAAGDMLYVHAGWDGGPCARHVARACWRPSRARARARIA